jgi:iron(II)-dependent oxidoreductase
MLNKGRYALLLRKQIIGNLSPAELHRTVEILSDRMAILPEGDVEIQPPDLPSDFDELFDHVDRPPVRIARVGRAYLDRHLVTNEDFHKFVQAGCYEQMAIWDPEIWPAVLDFVDQTGQPGPRLWRNGQCLPGQERHPVVGVSWYEAQAYARWVGKRLITEAEWVKSTAWPVALSPTSRVQRRFPWGDEMDRSRANLWHTGVGGTCPVDAFPGGVSTGGVYQLIGNVWEWTSTPFRAEESPFGKLTTTTPLKAIRGGAFDSYFDSQADSRFASCENPVERKHNIGFRCAINAADVTTKLENAAQDTHSAAAQTHSKLEPVTS